MSNNLTFVVKKGGLSRTASTTDHISALVFFTHDVAWTGAAAKKYYSLATAERDGFTATSAEYSEYWYHISEFFRMNPQGAVWVLMNPLSISQTLIQDCQGEVRQIAAYITDVAQIGSVWQALADTLDAAFCPAQIVVGWNGETAVAPASSAFNMQLKSSPNVSLLAAGDGKAKGASISAALGKKYLPAIGAVLGAMSRAKVSENIGWVEPFNYSNGKELETIKLSDGTIAPTAAQIEPYNSAKILVFEKIINFGGTYLTDTYTAILETDDYSTIENNRTMQKVKRSIRTALAPHAKRPVQVDTQTGTLSAGFISFIESEVDAPLTAMANNGDISGYFVSIAPHQNVLSTSIVEIEVGIIPMAVARKLIVNIGYRVQVSI